MKDTPFAHIFILISFLANGFGLNSLAQAQDFYLPAPGVMINLSPEFDPPVLKGIKVHPDDPFKFDFILDKGASQLSNDALKDESSKLIKYFLTSLTIPEKDLWVNLSPYEKDRIIPASFGLTEMGRDLLAEDYMLKQITASLIYPEGATGKRFWKRIYEEAQKRYGKTDVPVNTFNKVWIVPEKALVYENARAGTAYVVESKLKVMLEQDYISLQKHEGIKSATREIQDTNQLGSQIVRKIIIPELTKEVNQNKNFSQLRQVYNSLILATWYKKTIKDSILEQVYVNKKKVAGVNTNDPPDKERIYQSYLQAFKKGVYNCVIEDVDSATKGITPRKYFSGGASLYQVSEVFKETTDGAMFGLTGKTSEYLEKVRLDQAILSPFSEGSFKTDEIRRIWKYVRSEIKAHDPLIEKKHEGVLVKIFKHIDLTLHSIDNKVANGTIKLVSDFHLFKEQGVDRSDQKKPLSIGLLALTANPLNWGHIAAALDFVDQENVNFLVLLVQGGMKYKDLPEVDRVPEKVRHSYTKGVTAKLSPLIQYTDIGRNNERIGEFNAYELLQLNPNRDVKVYYLSGSETKERTYGVVRHFIEAAKYYRKFLSPKHKLTLGIAPVGVFGKGILTDEKFQGIIDEVSQQEKWDGPPIEGKLVAKDYDLEVHSSSYRRGDRGLVPSSINRKAEEQGYYGYPPRVLRGGQWVTLSMDEMIRERLKPLTQDLSDIIELMLPHQGGIVTIDGNSASGKSLIAELLQEDLQRKNRTVQLWGLDTKLRGRLYRHAIQKLVVGEELSNEEIALLSEEERMIGVGQRYTRERDFFDNDTVRQKLKEARNFFDGGDERASIVVENPYDQKTKKVLSAPLVIPLEKGTVLIVEGKYSNLPELQKYSNLRVRVIDDDESVRVRFELRTRKQSPNDADRQLIFFYRGLTPSFEAYTDLTDSAIDVHFNVSSEDPKRWKLNMKNKVMIVPIARKADLVSRDWMKRPDERVSGENLRAHASQIRLETLRIWKNLKGPLAGAFSIVDLYTAFFINFFNREEYLAHDERRMRFIPKGTSAAALYAAAGYSGLIDPQRILRLDKNDLQIIPHKFGFSDASLYKLGMSFEQGIGMALASKYTYQNYPVIVFTSDGALQLGVDHQAKFAASMGLNNLTLVVDVNQLQSSYNVNQVDLTLTEDQTGKMILQRQIWEAYGWKVLEIDGHDFDQIQKAYDQIGQSEKPLVIFAKTVKGKGVPFMENNPNYNHKAGAKEVEMMEHILNEQVEEWKAKGKLVGYPSAWHPSIVHEVKYRSVLPNIDPAPDIGLEKYLKTWIEELIKLNPSKEVVINTDNPSPFDKSTPIYSPVNHSPFIFAGINERFAINLAGGLSNGGISPIYIGPAAHMPVIAEDWKMYGIDKQNILLVARSAGSAMSHWGPAHLTYEDVELFKAPGASVFQPANAQDLRILLENYYKKENPSLSYIRLQDTEAINVAPDLYDSDSKRTQIFNDGYYVIDSNLPRDSVKQGYVVLVVTGKTVAEALKVTGQLKKRNISYKIINILNLTTINEAKFNVEVKGAVSIITAIDAKPESLSTLVFKTIVSGRDRIKSLGVSHGGNFQGEKAIFNANRLDAQGLLKTVEENVADYAMFNKGGIDLTPASITLQSKHSSEGIKFHIDPAMFAQLQNAPGFVPVIISFQPMIDLRKFLGLADKLFLPF